MTSPKNFSWLGWTLNLLLFSDWLIDFYLFIYYLFIFPQNWGSCCSCYFCRLSSPVFHFWCRCYAGHRMVCTKCWFEFFHSVLSSRTASSPDICTFHPSATSPQRPTLFNPSGRRAEHDVFHINKWLALSCGHYLGYMQILPVCIHPFTSWALISGRKGKDCRRNWGNRMIFFLSCCAGFL